MKCGEILVCCMTNISHMDLAECRRLVLDPLILLKWKFREVWTFLVVYIYHFKIFRSHLFKKMKHWNLDIIGY